MKTEEIAKKMIEKGFYTHIPFENLVGIIEMADEIRRANKSSIPHGCVDLQTGVSVNPGKTEVGPKDKIPQPPHLDDEEVEIVAGRVIPRFLSPADVLVCNELPGPLVKGSVTPYGCGWA